METLTLITPKKKEYSFSLPGSLNEMTEKQLYFLSTLIDKSVPVKEIKVMMLIFCLGGRLKTKYVWDKSPYYRIKSKQGTFKMTADDLSRSAVLFDYLFTEPDEDGNCFFDNYLTVCPFESVRIFGISFRVPEEALTNITYDQYIYLETYFDKMQSEPAMATAFLGALLTRKKKPFDKDKLYLQLMKFLPPRKIIILIWYFIGSVRFIGDKFPRLFPGSSGSSGQTMTLYDAQQRLLDFMVKADPAKKALVKEKNLYDVLYSLDYMLEEQEKIQKKI